MRCETFPELGGDCLEVKGRGHMAPDIAFFHQLFVSLQCWCIQRGGHRKSKGHFPGFLLFCSSSLSFFCYFFFNFLTVNFVKQAIQLHICFLLVLPHDVNSFHSYHVCGELITLIDSCEEGMSGCITVFSRAFLCVCVFVFFGAVGAGQDGGLLRSKQRERVSSAKFYLTQRKQNNHTSRTAQQHLSLPPLPPTPHDLQPTKNQPPHPLPLHPAFQQSDTLNLPLFLHAPTSPCQQLAVRHRHALCISFLLHLHHHYPHNDMSV